MLMRHSHPELQLTHILPYGAVVHDRGVQFVIFSRSATSMRLLLFDDVDDFEPAEIIEFDANRIVGEIFGASLYRVWERGSFISFRQTAPMRRKKGCVLMVMPV